MQRPRNRQGQPQNDRPRGQSSNNQRGGAARGGNRGNRRGPSTLYPQSVPNITEVTPNASVSIVLKMDQGTGRQVQGIVADVLTSGNHPRGIKVRLVDGRVGRVQRICREGEGGEVLERDGEGSERGGGSGRGRGRGRRYGDVREDEYLERPREGGYSLDDFLPANHPLMTQNESVSGNDTRDEVEVVTSPSHTCPVCGEFEGDEVAVSRHVGEHFD